MSKRRRLNEPGEYACISLGCFFFAEKGRPYCCNRCPQQGSHSRNCANSVCSTPVSRDEVCITNGCVRSANVGHHHCCSACACTGGRQHKRRCEANQLQSSLAEPEGARPKKVARSRRDRDIVPQESLRQRKTCPICLAELNFDSGQSVAIDPCGHMYCAACRLEPERCAVCRGPIRKTLRLYPS